MANQLSSSWKLVKPHIPLIRFRKATLQKFADIATSSSSSTLGDSGAVPSSTQSGDVLRPAALDDVVTPAQHARPSPPKTTTSTTVLEEWQLPASYYRPRFTEEEIDYINRGGPA